MRCAVRWRNWKCNVNRVRCCSDEVEDCVVAGLGWLTAVVIVPLDVQLSDVSVPDAAQHPDGAPSPSAQILSLTPPASPEELPSAALLSTGAAFTRLA
jgi:hypothetical protein